MLQFCFLSNSIRQRLLKNRTLTLDDMFSQARSLDIAQKSLESYSNVPNFNAAVQPLDTQYIHESNVTAAVPDSNKCWNCGNNRHSRVNCPAREVECNKFGRRGHFAKHCRSGKKQTSGQVASLHYPTLASITASTSKSLQKSIFCVQIIDLT